MHTPPPSDPSLVGRATDAVRGMAGAVKDRVEALAAQHRVYQKENEVPNQRTPVVADVLRDKERAEAEDRLNRDQDRTFEATLI